MAAKTDTKEKVEPTTILVNNKTKRIVAVAGVRFVPGVNSLLIKDWEVVKKDLGDRVGPDKEFSEVTETEKDADGKPIGKKAVDFSELSPDKAALIVAETKDVELLNGWLKTETRDSVRKAIYDQIDVLNKK